MISIQSAVERVLRARAAQARARYERTGCFSDIGDAHRWDLAADEVSCAARVAPEEVVFRPTLPQHFQPGMTEMHMDKEKLLPLGTFTDNAGQQWDARLETIEGQEPTVHLFGPARASYRLAQFLEVAAGSHPMTITSGYADGDVTLREWAREDIAAAALRRISPKDGHFEVRWIPNDPRAPF